MPSWTASRPRCAGPRDGTGSVVLISGEAGIGKTSLVRAFVVDRTDRVRVLLGACDDLVTPRTLGPLRDAVRGTGGPLATALAGGDRDAVLSALLARARGRHPSHRAGPRGRPLGRRRHPRRAALHRAPGGRPAGRGGRDLPRRGGRAVAAAGARRAGRSRRAPASPGPALPRGGGPAGRWHRGHVGTALPAHGRQPVLRLGAGRRDRVRHRSGAVPATVVDAVLARLQPARSRRAGGAGAAVGGALRRGAVAGPRSRRRPGRARRRRAERAAGDAGGRVAFRHELARRAVEAALPVAVRMQYNARVLAALLARARSRPRTRRPPRRGGRATRPPSSPTRRPPPAPRAGSARTPRRSRCWNRPSGIATCSTPAEEAALWQEQAMALFTPRPRARRPGRGPACGPACTRGSARPGRWRRC